MDTLLLCIIVFVRLHYIVICVSDTSVKRVGSGFLIVKYSRNWNIFVHHALETFLSISYTSYKIDLRAVNNINVRYLC